MAAHQAPPSLGFSRQEYWSGLPFPPPMHESEKWKWSHSVMSDSLRPHGLQPSRFLCPWDFPGKSTGVGCHCLLQKSSGKAFSGRTHLPWQRLKMPSTHSLKLSWYVVQFLLFILVELHCCVNYCCTAKWLSYICTFFICFSIMVYHWILNVVPCAIQ